ncbi:MAG TPA: hypothetical protein VJR29_14360 [bacterium]|nr:hypothetical protein [bacterium]
MELSATSHRELASLRAESDPELLALGLLNWAGREERAHRPAAAALAYRFISENPADLSLSEDLRQRAQGRLAVLGGAGTVGARAEYQLSRFTHEVSNPAFIAAFATGSWVFNAGRAALLARLASPGQAVLGARYLATAGAFSMEVPAVWATAKGITELMAPGSQSWSADTNLRELASLAITLGAFKFGANAVGRAAVGAPAASRGLLVQGGSLAGIALGRQLEVAVGLRAPTDAASAAIDSVALLLQANVGARVARTSLGSRFEAQSQALESFARQGESLAWSRLTSSLRGTSLQFASLTAGPRAFRGQGPDMIGQGPDMIGQGPDMISRGGAHRALFGQGPDMITGQGPDMIRPLFGQGPDMIFPAGQGPDMIRPVFGQGPDMRTALQ